MKYIRFCISLCLLLPIAMQAQEIYDLKLCLEKGLDSNYEILIVRNEQKISDNNKTVGNAGYLPTIDLGASYSGTINNTTQDKTDATNNKFNNIHNQVTDAGIDLNWILFDGFQMQANYAKLKEFQQMGELNTRLSIEDFIAKLTAEYYNYVRQNIRLENLRYAVDLSKERVRIVEARYNIGSLSRLDLQQARVDFNADSSNLIRQQEVLYTSCINLNQLMALEDVSQKLRVRDSVILLNILLDENNIRSKTLISNTSLLLSEKNKTISQLNYRAVKSRNYPYLKMNAGYGISNYTYESGAIESQRILGLNYGLTMGLNLFDGFNRSREKKNAQLQIQNKKLEYDQLELAVKADLANIWMAYKNNIELTNLETQNLQTARENYEIAIERYKLGSLSGIELREAQNSLLAAEERLLLAQYNTKLCEISLLQISGQVTSYLE